MYRIEVELSAARSVADVTLVTSWIAGLINTEPLESVVVHSIRVEEADD